MSSNVFFVELRPALCDWLLINVDVAQSQQKCVNSLQPHVIRCRLVTCLWHQTSAQHWQCARGGPAPFYSAKNGVDRAWLGPIYSLFISPVIGQIFLLTAQVSLNWWWTKGLNSPYSQHLQKSARHIPTPLLCSQCLNPFGLPWLFFYNLTTRVLYWYILSDSALLQCCWLRSWRGISSVHTVDYYAVSKGNR